MCFFLSIVCKDWSVRFGCQTAHTPAMPSLLHIASGPTLRTSLVHTATDLPKACRSFIPLRDTLHFCQVWLNLVNELKGDWDSVVGISLFFLWKLVKKPGTWCKLGSAAAMQEHKETPVPAVTYQLEYDRRCHLVPLVALEGYRLVFNNWHTSRHMWTHC